MSRQSSINALEEWRPIKGYEGLYEISSIGRVKSIERVTKYRPCTMWPKGKTSRRPEKMMKLKNAKRGGYPIVTLTKNSNQRQWRVHRLVAIAFIPNPKNKTDVNHIDGVTDNNKIGNLEWVTASENALHSYRVLKREPTSLPTGLKSKSTTHIVYKYHNGTVVDAFFGCGDAARSVGGNRDRIWLSFSRNQKYKGFNWKIEKFR